jgi:predicted DNA-binding protein
MVYNMPSIKVTFTLDESTVGRLGRTAERLGMPKSQVVREAIREYSDRIGRLGEDERLRLLRTFDEMVPAIPARPAEEVEREIEEVRDARRAGDRGKASEEA